MTGQKFLAPDFETFHDDGFFSFSLSLSFFYLLNVRALCNIARKSYPRIMRRRRRVYIYTSLRVGLRVSSI